MLLFIRNPSLKIQSFSKASFGSAASWITIIKEKILKTPSQTPYNPFLIPVYNEKECQKVESIQPTAQPPKDAESWNGLIARAENLVNSSTISSPAKGFLSEKENFLKDGRSEKDYFSSLFVKLESIIGDSKHPLINTINSYYLQAEGKRLRPLMILLLAKSFKPTNWSAFEMLAGIAELMHTASLMHDDVIDSAYSRRSLLSAPILFGNKAAVLSGDYLLASASIQLARLGSLPVVHLMSQVICDLARGELMQMDVPPNEKSSLDYYLEKSFRKTACLIAKSFQSASILAGNDKEIHKASFEFGRYFGTAFQAPSKDFGKSSAQDLKNGYLTAPFLFALQEDPFLKTLLERAFSQPDDIQTAFNIITSKTNALEKTKKLAQDFQNKAIEQLEIIQSKRDIQEENIEILKALTRSLSSRRK